VLLCVCEFFCLVFVFLGCLVLWCLESKERSVVYGLNTNALLYKSHACALALFLSFALYVYMYTSTQVYPHF